MRAAKRASAVNGRSPMARPRSLLRLRLGHVLFGRLRYGGLVLDLERRLHVVAEDLRRHVHRELAYGRVVVLHGVDVAITRDGDAVLRAFELRLEVAEVG